MINRHISWILSCSHPGVVQWKLRRPGQNSYFEVDIPRDRENIIVSKLPEGSRLTITNFDFLDVTEYECYHDTKGCYISTVVWP